MLFLSALQKVFAVDASLVNYDGSPEEKVGPVIDQHSVALPGDCTPDERYQIALHGLVEVLRFWKSKQSITEFNVNYEEGRAIWRLKK